MFNHHHHGHHVNSNATGKSSTGVGVGVFPAMLGLGAAIHSHRTFSTTPATPSAGVRFTMGTEAVARVINGENGYPNNMRKVQPAEEVVSSPRIGVHRTVSECPSEDSYIVFEEGCDDEEDDIDGDVFFDSDDEEVEEDEEEDSEEDIKPVKKVTFAPTVHVHPMVAWAYAYRASRKGHWEQYARDRARFQRRREIIARELNAVLAADHRQRVFAERFAPFLLLPEETGTKRSRTCASEHDADAKKVRKQPRRNKRRRNGKKRKRNRHKFKKR